MVEVLYSIKSEPLKYIRNAKYFSEIAARSLECGQKNHLAAERLGARHLQEGLEDLERESERRA